MKKHKRKDCPFIHVQNCEGCGRSCACHKKKPLRSTFDRASERLDIAAVTFAAEQMLMNLSWDDDGTRAAQAWRELQRAARAFVRSKKRKKR